MSSAVTSARAFARAVVSFCFVRALKERRVVLSLEIQPSMGLKSGGVRREMHHAGTGRFHQLEGLGRIVTLDVVEQDDMPGAQAGDEQGLDVYRVKTSELTAPSIIMGAQTPCIPMALLTETLLSW